MRQTARKMIAPRRRGARGRWTSAGRTDQNGRHRCARRASTSGESPRRGSRNPRRPPDPHPPQRAARRRRRRPRRTGRPRALTVSQLTDRIQGVLETELFDVWVEGEVSNLRFAESGHWYFSLKDADAQVRAVVWKKDARLVKFRPRDGMKVLARGSLRVYPPRGEYQLAVQVLEPLGKGSLQQAFEELKAKLEREGLFEAARKRALPALPRRVGVVSSPDRRGDPRHPARAAHALREPRAGALPRARAGRGRGGGDRQGDRGPEPPRRARRDRARARRRQPGGPLGLQRGEGRAGDRGLARCRRSRRSATRRTSRSPTSSPTCAPRRPRRPPSAWCRRRTSWWRGSRGSSGGGTPRCA